MARSNTVCVVDDDEPVRDSLGVLLESHGYTVRVYPSAADFLLAGAQHDAGCLVVDMRMAKMSGLELVDCLRQSNSALPAILLSADADMLGRGAQALGILRALPKPVADEELSFWIDKALAADGG